MEWIPSRPDLIPLIEVFLFNKKVGTEEFEFGKLHLRTYFP